jgi:hypothetical protein
LRASKNLWVAGGLFKVMIAEGGKGSALGAGSGGSAASDLGASETGAVAGFDAGVAAEATAGVHAGSFPAGVSVYLQGLP